MDQQMIMEMAIRARSQLAGMDDFIRKGREAERAVEKLRRNLHTKFEKIQRDIKKMKRSWSMALNDMRKHAEAFKNTATKFFMSIVATTGIGSFFVKMASDFDETVNKFNTAFGEMADTSRTFVEQLAEDMSRSRKEMLNFAADSQAMLASMIGSREAAAEMSKAFTALSVDLGSFFNIADDQAFTRLMSGIVGETEAVRRLGVDISQARLEMEAMKVGINKNWQELSQAEKVYLRFIAILEQTQDAQGDAVKTAMSFQNQFKALKADLADVALTIGQELMPYALGLVHWIDDAVEALKDLNPETKTTLLQFAGIVAIAPTLVFGIATIGRGIMLTVKAVQLLTKALQTNPYLVLSTVLAGLALTIDEVREGLNSILENIPGFDKIFEIGDAFNELNEALTGLEFNPDMSGAEKFKEMYGDVLAGIIEDIKNLPSTIGGEVEKTTGQMLGDILSNLTYADLKPLGEAVGLSEIIYSEFNEVNDTVRIGGIEAGKSWAEGFKEYILGSNFILQLLRLNGANLPGVDEAISNFWKSVKDIDRSIKVDELLGIEFDPKEIIKQQMELRKDLIKELLASGVDKNSTIISQLIGQYKELLKKLDDPPDSKTWTEIITEAINNSELMNRMGDFFSNLGDITGNETYGLIGSIIPDINGFSQAWTNFNAEGAGLMDRLTSGLGMANAALGVVSAFKSWNDARNQREEQEWAEQKKLDEEQLEHIRAIEENTRKTARDLIKILAQNPTISNIAQTQDLMESMWGSLTSSLIPNFGKVAIKVVEDDLVFDDKKTVKYDPVALMRKMGYDMSQFSDGSWFSQLFGSIGSGSIFGHIFGSSGTTINDLNFEQLEEFYNMAKTVSKSDLKKVAQDIADGMDAFGNGELKDWESNWDKFLKKLENYLEIVEDLEISMSGVAASARYESFAGIEWLNAQEQVEAYRKQLEELYAAAGKNINKYSKEINKAVQKYADAVVDGGERIITIMQNVRQGFIDAFSAGENAALSFAAGLRSYFDTIKQNIASLFYDIQMDELDAQFKQFFGDFIDELAGYEGDNVIGFASQLLQSGDMQELFADLIDIYGTMDDMNSVNDILIEQFREAAEAAGMTAEEIDEMLNSLGLVSEEVQRIAETMNNALQSAMQAALESENLRDFYKSMGESIYNSAKDGLIQAFMESEVYQEMFKQWFDVSGIEFTGNLEQDFANMNDMLDSLYDELKAAGLDFNYTEVAGEDEGTQSSDYYSGANVSGEGGTVINNKYIYAPSGKFYGQSDEELFEEFLEWKDNLDDDEV